MTGFIVGVITGIGISIVVYLVFKKVERDLDEPNKHKWL